MQYQPIDRPVDAFQQAVDPAVVPKLCRRAFGSATSVDAVIELPWGAYNNAYRVELGTGRAVVLRVAPEPKRQFRVEQQMMRNEYAAAPYLAAIGDLLPRILFADFTHQVIGRDYLIESLLPGVPAPDGMARYPRPQWAGLFEQIGEVSRRIHSVRGSGFGSVADPRYEKWSAALVAYFRDAAEDVRDAGHDWRDVSQLATAAERFSVELDEITEPRLLHGDLWTANVLVDPETAALTMTGVCDWDRAKWGDPLADWSIQRALLKPGTEREAFWTGYGQPRSVATGVRQLLYQARFAVELRLDRIRLRGADSLADSYQEIGDILRRLD